MCGICGFIGFNDDNLLRSMLSSIAHRGPDAQGVFVDSAAGVSLGHARLSIIDLSSSGRQPMSNEDGSIHLVFNGEIYNYRELKQELTQKGHVFKSKTDTEVVLRLYEEKGVDLLNDLDGMFAFALYDKRNKRFFLARDRLGIKPCYYSLGSDGSLVFASELKALLLNKRLSRDLDYKAVCDHLTFLWAPAPKTVLKHVRKLEAGHFITITDGKFRKEKWWDIPYDGNYLEDGEEAVIERVTNLLEEAAEKQLMSDVPVGAFLSGGLDSSAVVAMVKTKHPDLKLRCYTTHWGQDKKSSEGFHDDLHYARKVAKRYNLDHREIKVEPNLAEDLEKMIYHLDEPQADLAPLNVMAICKIAREDGVKVLLSGTGGDDVFSGYRRHQAVYYEKFLPLPDFVRKKITGYFSGINIAGPLSRRLAKFSKALGEDLPRRHYMHFNWTDLDIKRSLLSADVRAAIAGYDDFESFDAALPAIGQEENSLNRMLFLDEKFFLPDHNLNYTDKASMLHGIEVRPPLLDHRLVEYLAKVPPQMKMKGGTPKYLFKKSMERYLDRDVIYRPKTGFGAPVRSLVNGDLRELIGDVLSQTSLKRRGVFNATAVETLIGDTASGKRDGAYTILSILCFELWSKSFLSE